MRYLDSLFKFDYCVNSAVIILDFVSNGTRLREITKNVVIIHSTWSVVPVSFSFYYDFW